MVTELQYEPRTGPSRLGEVARLFLRLGFTAFGGPAAHIALMEDEVVNRRKWLDRQHFLDLVSTLNFIPGPNSTELAIHLGLIRAGMPGLVVAGVCFIVPAMLIILPIAWLYVEHGQTPRALAALAGIKACMVAIVAVALVRFAKTGIKDKVTLMVAVVAAAAGFVLPKWRVPQSELMILGAAAIAGIAIYGRNASSPQAEEPQPAAKRFGAITPLGIFPMIGSAFWGQMLTMSLFFLKVGATLFGSGYVLASYLYVGLVERHRWLTSQQLIDAIAVGQVTPGPLLTTATFIGYVLGAQNFGGGVTGGIAGGVLATVAIFLPAFLFIAIFGPVLPRIRKSPWARGALDGMNAAVVALIAVVAVWLARDTLWIGGRPDWLAVSVFAGSLALLLWTKLNATWVILAAAVVSLGVRRIA